MASQLCAVNLRPFAFVRALSVRTLGGRKRKKILHPVRFQVVPQALPTDPFKSTPPILPLTQLERRMSEQPPADPLADAEIIDQITPLAEKPDSILTLREPRFMGEKSAEFEAVRDTFISLEDLSLEMERQRAEEKAGYVRRWMPDADTTDADSRKKSRRNRRSGH